MKFHALTAVAFLWCSNALAVDMPELSIKRKCSECHAIDRKLAGPSFTDIARHYRGNKDAPVFLTYKIQNGGFGIWGQDAMPSQHVTEDEARQLAAFILGLAPPAPSAASRQRETAQKQKRRTTMLTLEM